MKVNKKIVVSLMFFACFSFIKSIHCRHQTRAHLSEWTILTYIQADNNLSPFASLNINAMLEATYNGKVNKLVQWIKPEGNLVGRYSMQNDGKIRTEDILPVASTINHETAVVDAMHWAVKNHPAKKYMLVFWNHGSGIIDYLNYPMRRFNGPIMRPWLEIPGLAPRTQRGILYSDNQKNFMNNMQLKNALRTIKEDVLGRSIDIVGMDACLMAMLEVGYQIKDYANILVASQNSEPGIGWIYDGFLKPLTKQPSEFTPYKLAHEIVTSYRKYYHNKLSFITQSAIDLKLIDQTKQAVDNICREFYRCKRINAAETINTMKRARFIAVKFDTRAFVDLCSLLQGIIKTNNLKIKNPKKSMSYHYINALKRFNKKAGIAIKTIKEAIIANTAGASFKQAQGISIYFPQKSIHKSYNNVTFSKESRWLSVLRTVLNIKKKKPNKPLGSEHDE